VLRNVNAAPAGGQTATVATVSLLSVHEQAAGVRAPAGRLTRHPHTPAAVPRSGSPSRMRDRAGKETRRWP